MDIGYHALCCHVIRLRFGSLALLVRLCGAPGAFGLGFLLAPSRWASALSCWAWPSLRRSSRSVMFPTTSLALPFTPSTVPSTASRAPLCSAMQCPLSGRPTRDTAFGSGAPTVCIRWLPRAGPSVNAALMADSPTPFRTGARGNPRLMGASRNSTTSARSSSAPAVLFDVDGTLVDSNYLHVHAWQRAFTQAGFDVEAWRTHRSIGMDGSIL